jgi:colanic acid/amylovoran biosynthesis glycosyltransferase
MDEFRASRITQLPQARRFRLIHAHFGHVGAEVLGAAQKLGIPLVTNFYGSDTAPFTDDPTWPDRRKRLFAEGALFLVEGAFMRQRLIELGAPPEKVRLQRISFRFDQLPPKGMAHKARPPVMLFAGRFVEKKGLQYGLEAAAEMHKAGLSFEFRIIGGGPLEPEHRGIVERAGMDSKIRFLGLLPRARYLEELAQADIFVSPSVTAANGDTEGGAPTTILEAQAMGIPVLATTHADIPNITVPGQSAFLAPERDTKALSEHMRALLEDRSLWNRMGRAGQEYVSAHHDVSREARHLEESYFSVL